ncbi:MAG: ABC transporter permease [Bacteroidota bacterium]
MLSERFTANLRIALEAVFANRIRSLLTALGIIFGVAAVIAMLAIGNGAQQEILEQMKLVGVNNIVIKPITEQSEKELGEVEDGQDKKKFSPGLTLRDMESIKTNVPGISKLSPEIVLDTYVIKNGSRRSAKLVGVEPSYFELTNFELAQGRMFNRYQMERGEPVCVIGKSIKAKFFPTEDPIGKSLKCGKHWLKIIGVLEERLISDSRIKNLGIRDFNMDIYTPLKTVLIRYENRELITQSILRRAQIDERRGLSKDQNYHQLDKLVVRVDDTEMLAPVAEVLSRLLKRKHYDVVDYEITIPELLLQQQQRTKNIFKIVLGVIAGISLLVGGIGIMNIMLASVMERIKEIGLRLSIGAKKNDIVIQFLMEAVMISVSGGLIGVMLGITMASVVSGFADIPTIITFSSILLSFGFAAMVGLIFGIAPAQKAAQQDPITSLRYE